MQKLAFWVPQLLSCPKYKPQVCDNLSDIGANYKQNSPYHNNDMCVYVYMCDPTLSLMLHSAETSDGRRQGKRDTIHCSIKIILELLFEGKKVTYCWLNFSQWNDDELWVQSWDIRQLVIHTVDHRATVAAAAMVVFNPVTRWFSCGEKVKTFSITRSQDVQKISISHSFGFSASCS